MIFKIKRKSHCGNIFEKPCEGAFPTSGLTKDGLAIEWGIEIDDVRSLANREGKLIIEKDGTVIIYDDFAD